MADEQKKTEKKRYRHNLNTIKRLLSGKSTIVLHELEKQMEHYSKKEEYREAATVKTQLEKLKYLISPRFSPASYMENPNLYADLRAKELESLSEILKINMPSRIEGYDISNISGTDATGSMVVFTNGEKDTNNYRRFKIKTKNTPDDFHMMHEMLTRRLRHDEWDMPDLFLIDGGAGQVSTALSALKARGVTIPLVGLAKRFEEIVVPIEQGDELEFRIIKIPVGSPALSLLQRIRDEAHRYARSYHHLLRKKKMIY
jgi:excinuclease ABC subunit C